MNTIPVLDKGSVTLLEVLGSDDLIANAARTSYKSSAKTSKDNDKLIGRLLRHGHMSPFEMCEMIFVIEAPIFVARQWFRHRTASLNEVSARYTVVEDKYYVPKNIRGQSKTNKQMSVEEDIYGKDLIIASIEQTCKELFKIYNQLLNMGVAREQARIILPLTTYTRFYWKMNLRNILHFIKLRTAEDAQWETRQYANVIAQEVKNHFPIVWRHFEDCELNSLKLTSRELVKIKSKLEETEDIQVSEDDDLPSASEFKEKAERLGLHAS